VPAKADAIKNKYWALRRPPYEIVAGYPLPYVEVVAWGGSNQNLIYAGTTDPVNDTEIPDGIYRSANEGLTWEYLGKVDEHEQVKVLTVHPTKPNIILAGFERTYYQGGIYRSEDSGNTWTSVLPYLIVKDIEVDPSDPSIMYATGLESGGMPTPIHMGVYKRIDEGRTWQYVSTSYFSDIEVHPKISNVLFATRWFSTASEEGVYRSDDSGETWKQISGIQQSHIVINGNNPDQMFIFGGAYNGIWRTNDSGQTWQDVTSNLAFVWGPVTIQTAVFESDQSNTLYVGLKYGGMYLSNDGGETWQQESDGLSYGPQCTSSDSINSQLIIACSGYSFIQKTVTTNGIDTVGVFRPSNGVIFLKNTNTTGFADVALNYGIGGDYPVVGDWDGNGTDTIGVYRNGVFYLRKSNTIGYADYTFLFGAPGDQPVAGDWNGDGKDTIGVYRNGTFYLRNSNDSGAPDMIFALGVPGDVGIAGDWTGKGYDTTGVFRPSNGALYLKNKNETGYADVQINYGIGGDQPVTGDWNDDGIDTIGVLRGNTFYLRNENTIGYADIVFALGNPGDMPIAGNWDGKP